LGTVGSLYRLASGRRGDQGKAGVSPGYLDSIASRPFILGDINFGEDR
jgi:hypothetical protein